MKSNVESAVSRDFRRHKKKGRGLEPASRNATNLGNFRDVSGGGGTAVELFVSGSRDLPTVLRNLLGATT